MADTSMALAVIPSSGVDTYRMSTDAAGISKAIVLKTAMEIQGRKYVKVEGWQAIALAHGCTASSCNVERVDGGFRATGQVRRMDTGAVIAEAEGFVGEDEPVWFGGEVTDRWGKKKVHPKRADYAIRAMAQTRSISRACRSAFAHVVVMMDANLQTTPAEEVPLSGFDDVDPDIERLAPKNAPRNPATGELLSNYQVNKAKKAAETLKESAKLAIGLCQNRPELKAWLKENRPALEEALSADDFDRVIEAVDERWEVLPIPEKVA